MFVFHIWWKGSEAGIPEDKDLVTLDGTVKKNLGDSPSEVRKSVAFCLGVNDVFGFAVALIVLEL